VVDGINMEKEVRRVEKVSWRRIISNYKGCSASKSIVSYKGIGDSSSMQICLIYRVIQNDCRGTIVQRQFRTKFRKQSPSDNSIRRWYAQFQERGCVCIPELKVRIRTAIETITADMHNELDYRVDVCRITKGAHIEHL